MAYFNYRNLDPTEFEALAKDVMERLLVCSLNRYGSGQDDGIDLRDDKKRIVVQCKRYQQGSFDKMYSILKREEKPKIDKLEPRLERYYVFTSLELNPQQKQKILELFKEYMEDESCIIDGIAINDFFRDEHNHDLISRNIKLFLSFPENYKYSPSDLSQIEENRLYARLFGIFENDRKIHPSIRMMDHLDPLLFPKGQPEILSDGRYATEETEDARVIRDMISDSWKREDRRHILLVGEGGIGKTVAMLTLPEEDWFRKLGIPVIYVPLQRLDAFKGDLNRYIREKIGSDNYELCIELVNRNPKGHPRLLLLLDGFNEIPDKYKDDAGSYIREWMDRPGTQIITTSRLGFSLENKFSKYRLQPLQYGAVRSFLLSAGIKEEQLPGENDRVWEAINVPLMLTMYTQIEKVRETANRSSSSPVLEWKEPDNAAHIIWDYLQMELYRCIDRHDSTRSAMQYATAIFAVAPYICCQMNRKNEFHIKREVFLELIRKALTFHADHQELLGNQLLNIRDEFDPYHEEVLFREEDASECAKILIDNIGLFQTQRNIRPGHRKGANIDYSCSLMHQNFRDALAAFFICSCLSKTCKTKEKKDLLNQADYYVKEYMAGLLSGWEIADIWDRHRKEEPDDGQITFILMDLIGRQRNYDYQELNFSGLDLTRTNLHRLLSQRLDICPLPGDSNKLRSTKISVNCLLPIGHVGVVRSVAYSFDGKYLASGADDGTLRIWNLESGEGSVLKGHAGRVLSVAWNPDGRSLASGANDRTIRIWNIDSGESRVLKGHAGGVRSVAYSIDGKHLASGSADRTVRIWNLETGESHVLEGHTGGVRSVAYSPDGRHLASGSSDWMVRVWDLETGESRVFKGHAGKVRSVAYRQDGRQLASGANDRMIRIWNIDSGESHVLEGHTGGVRSVAYSPDGRHLASGSSDWMVRVWDLVSGESRVLKGHAGVVGSVAYNPDGRQIVSGASDRVVRIWNLESGKSRMLEGHTDRVGSVAFSPDRKYLANGSSDGTVRIWNLESGECCVLDGRSGGVLSVAFSRDGKQLAYGSSDRIVRVWNFRSRERYELEGHTGGVYSVAYSIDGRYLSSGAGDCNVHIWDLKSDRTCVLKGHTGGVRSIAYSPDGRQLASGSSDRTVRIWNLESGESHVLYGHADRVLSVAYSPGGRQLASGSADKTVRTWDLESRKSHILGNLADQINCVTYSPDGKYIASGSDDGMVRIWDLETGESRVLGGHVGWIYSLSYSSDGRRLASGADDGTVRIWDLEEFREVGKYIILPHLNLSRANFEAAIIDEKDKEMLRAAGARV